MALSDTQPLRDALASALPDRPFALAFWDGTRLEATEDGAGLTFELRSPRAVAHVLRAPGQLGLGRAYVDGSIVPDDLDAALALVTTWSPPAIDRAARAPPASGRSCEPWASRVLPAGPRSSWYPAAGATRANATRARCAITTTSPTTSSRSCSARR